jgi:integrase
VKRPRLYQKGTNTLRFGTHGFRHSFATRSLATGKTDDWVRQRTGHTSDELLTYRESAKALEELHLADVQPLINAIPKLAR